ncbi:MULTISPECIES: hypothetical protein [unclassified Pseudactinotalea]|uniref:hypothetical protein n=1 Tax=unclassified Pseudactinotalea TaxID=2649176 RepID=UPI00128DA951|nr:MULTISPECIES: hypothetical protein [unclassified Pseudactinotalea]MPV50809.1 hypothetical protein [Pseudactinotalea sp. HY160]QGH70345.1 hypothetical protein GCE65_13225 [Pseudactinotalea sp. HY158]
MSASSDDSSEDERNEPARNPYAAPKHGAPTPPPRAPEPRRPAESQRPGEPNGPRQGMPELPDKEQLKELGRSLAWFGAAMLGTFLASQLPLPVGAATPVLGVATIWLGVRAIIRSRKISTRNLLTPMAIMGIVLALLLTLAGTSRVVLWPIEVAKQECLQLAITNTARTECVNEYNTALQERLDSLTPGS